MIQIRMTLIEDNELNLNGGATDTETMAIVCNSIDTSLMNMR